MSNDPQLAAMRQELQQLTQQLYQALAPGLFHAMSNPTWYLTSVNVGLESLNALYEISRLVYREHTAHSEGGRRLANMRFVYEKLSELSGEGQNQRTRTQIMIDIMQPLGMLLQEFRGGGDAQSGSKQRNTILAQLATDIRLNLLRLKAFGKMAQDLRELLSFRFMFMKQARFEQINQIHRQYIAFADHFGFYDANVLYSNATVKEIVPNVEAERDRLQEQAELVRNRIYSDKYLTQRSDDIQADLVEQKVVSILTDVSRDGFDFLNRANEAYFHACQHTGVEVRLLTRVSELGVEVSEREVAAASG